MLDCIFLLRFVFFFYQDFERFDLGITLKGHMQQIVVKTHIHIFELDKIEFFLSVLFLYFFLSEGYRINNILDLKSNVRVRILNETN